MIAHRIDAESDDLAAAPLELGFQARHVAKLGRADRREVLGMREQHGPAIVDPVMKVDCSLGGLDGEVRCLVVGSR